jgi:hypothetical protein
VKSLKDQLSAVKKDLVAREAADKAAAKEQARVAAKAKRVKAEQVSDEELFARAVAGVQPSQKFDSRPLAAGEKVGNVENDADLFKRFVGKN